MVHVVKRALALVLVLVLGACARGPDTATVQEAIQKQLDDALGGRVLTVTALGGTVKEAQRRAYQSVDQIDWPEGFCRRDIGWREIARSTV